uniref:Myb/SANT-like domain-containing protein n=1 Tax=Hordeum vulgare subsp. vulgare TaxID=112509 RepID=A0A8I6Z9U5_HORVV
MMLKEDRKQSGVGWDDKRCMIEADTDLWDNLMISYPSIRKFKKKYFPLFDLLGELYDAHTTMGTCNFTSIAQPSQIEEDFEDEREVEEVKESDDLEMMNQVQHDEDDLQILDKIDVSHRKEDVNPSKEVGRRMTGSGKMPQKKPNKETPKNSEDVIAQALEKYIELKKRQVDDEVAYLANEKGRGGKIT